MVWTRGKMHAIDTRTEKCGNICLLINEALSHVPRVNFHFKGWKSENSTEKTLYSIFDDALHQEYLGTRSETW